MKQLINVEVIWKYFQMNGNFVTCKICKKTLKCRRYADNLKAHLERMHPEVLRSEEEVHQEDPPTSTEADKPSCSKKSKSNRAHSRDLSLHAKVAAINLYDRCQSYGTVARHFPCTAAYIEKLIDSRDEILKEWNAQIGILDSVCAVQHRANKAKKLRKQILNKEMNGWIRRCIIYDSKFIAPDELITAKAIDVMKLYNLPKFVPNADWISRFRKQYNLKNGEDPPSDSPEGDTTSSEADHRPTPELPLHVKVAAIRRYDRCQAYSNVARHFPCSVQDIKEIIGSRNKILKEWSKKIRETPIIEQRIVFMGYESPVQHRKRENEMKILNNGMDDWIRGCMNDPIFVATDEVLEARAIELMRIYNLKNVVPDKDWISSIREKYGMKNGEDPPSDASEADMSTSEEDNNLPAEDQVRPIKEFNRMPQFPIIDQHKKPTTLSCRKCRIARHELLYDSMFEWLLRMQAKGNGDQLNRDLILQTAEEVNKHVKIPQLKPGEDWFNKFRQKYNLTTTKEKTYKRLYHRCGERKNHLSLEIPDIIDFVKQQKNMKTSKRRNAHRESNCGGVVEDIVPVDECAHSQESQELDDVIDGAAVTYVEIDEITDDDISVKCEEDDDGNVPVKCEEDDDGNVPVKCEEDLDDEVPVKCEEDDDGDVSVKCEEDADDGVPVKCEEDVETLEIIELVDGDVLDEDDVEEEYEPSKVNRVEAHDSRHNKRFIRDDEDALRYVKALENFALLQANFRAIGVISQLEAVYRSLPNP